MSWVTWRAVFVVGLLLLASNIWCWRPGIGSARNEPHGTELELFYGWPATYQAEWWRSDDVTLGSRLLQSAPFYSFADEMEIRDRYFGWDAVLANLAFAAAALGSVAIMIESAARQRHLAHWEIVTLVLAALVMAAVLAAADRLSQHL